MSRVNLGEGRWFETKRAKSWDENTRWNGNNHVSCATGTQWDHERLWRTGKGVYVLHHWSQWQGSGESWTIVDDHTAHTWLVDQGHSDDVPAEFLADGET